MAGSPSSDRIMVEAVSGVVPQGVCTCGYGMDTTPSSRPSRVGEQPCALRPVVHHRSEQHTIHAHGCQTPVDAIYQLPQTSRGCLHLSFASPCLVALHCTSRRWCR